MRKKANFKDDILEAAAGEPIQAIRIFDTSGYGLDKWRDVEPGLYRWAEVEALLDREYDDGWGHQDCPEIHAWTASMVLCIHEYDGSTYVRSLPRHPDVAS